MTFTLSYTLILAGVYFLRRLFTVKSHVKTQTINLEPPAKSYQAKNLSKKIA